MPAKKPMLYNCYDNIVLDHDSTCKEHVAFLEGEIQKQENGSNAHQCSEYINTLKELAQQISTEEGLRDYQAKLEKTERVWELYGEKPKEVPMEEFITGILSSDGTPKLALQDVLNAGFEIPDTYFSNVVQNGDFAAARLLHQHGAQFIPYSDYSAGTITGGIVSREIEPKQKTKILQFVTQELEEPLNFGHLTYAAVRGYKGVVDMYLQQQQPKREEGKENVIDVVVQSVGLTDKGTAEMVDYLADRDFPVSQEALAKAVKVGGKPITAQKISNRLGVYISTGAHHEPSQAPPTVPSRKLPDQHQGGRHQGGHQKK